MLRSHLLRQVAPAGVSTASSALTATQESANASGTSYTSPSLSIGAVPGAGETRYIYAVVGTDHGSTSGAPSFSSVTIAGETATEIGHEYSGDNRWAVTIYRAEVSTGTTGTISFTASKNLSAVCLAFYRAINYDTTAETVTEYNDSTWPNSTYSVTLTVSDNNSMVLAGFFGNQNAQYPNYNIGGTSIIDAQFVADSDAYEAASSHGEDSGSLTLSSSRSTSAHANSAGVFVVVSPL